jgi:anti-anti-sigma factor
MEGDPMELRINANAEIALFLVKGKVGWDNSRILDTQIHKMIEQGCSHIVFNLDEVSFLCSGGIGALIYNMKRVQERGGDIFIVSNSEYIQYLFATIGFNMIFQGRIFESFEAFSEKILNPKGLTFNLFNSFSSVIQTEEHRTVEKSRNAA